MKNGKYRIGLLFIIMVLTVLACGSPTAVPATEEPSTVTPLPNDEAVVISDESTATPPPALIQHQISPISLPTERNNQAGDYDSSKTAPNEEAPGGDRFTFDDFERPFNANTMDIYYPEIDIVDTMVFHDETWIYATITLKDRDVNNALSGKYALELDMDLDGKGDFLVMAAQPASTEWTVDRVSVWQDENKDVGGSQATVTDDHPADGDGFEKNLFQNGEGADADLAWARVSPENPLTVQLAVKLALNGGDTTFLAGAWAGHDALDPSKFDLNDHMTHEQAGAAMRGYEVYYPIKALAEIDNTCRMSIGFEPNGTEPGLCKELIPHDPAATPGPQGCMATSDEIKACNTNPYGHWNENKCTCEENIPR